MSYLHVDLGKQVFKRRRQVDGDAPQVLAPEARPRNPALPGRPGAVFIVVPVLVASKTGLGRRRRELEMQLPSNSSLQKAELSKAMVSRRCGGRCTVSNQGAGVKVLTASLTGLDTRRSCLRSLWFTLHRTLICQIRIEIGISKRCTELNRKINRSATSN